MHLYELTTLEAAFGTAGKVAEAVESWVATGKGQLCGAWMTDLGILNRIMVLRRFNNLEDLFAERERALRSDNAFGCVEHLVSLSMESYKSFDFMPEIEAGDFGPVFEIRTYLTKLNGLVPTLEKWQEYLPGREEYSKLTIALYALDGEPKITHIWPYRSLEERSKIRAQSVGDAKWPPKGGPDWLTTNMISQIAYPLAFSPLK